MLTQLTSFTVIGLDCRKIVVEIGSLPGEADMCIVGLGDTAVQESKQRVRLALRTSGYKIPTGRSVTVNLAPADLRKAGPRFDLPIALGMLLAHGLADIPEEALRRTAVLGELALDGSLRHVSGVLSAAIACREHGITRLVVPAADAAEAMLIPGVEVIGARSLREAAEVLSGKASVPAVMSDAGTDGSRHDASLIDFADVRGQEHAKRALEIAAAGGHNVLLCGAPGAGKTLLARALPGILPRLRREESIEVTQIYSVANRLTGASALIERRPFRVVHHTASAVSIVGGGQIPGPGEISLAHKGVLFLDELAEFPPPVLEVLRQPLEDRRITITRAHGSITFPADFILVAAMNPPEPGQARRSLKRISGPLLDRIDLTIAVDPVPIEDLSRPAEHRGESSTDILARVTAARSLQEQRFDGEPIGTNKEMSVRHIDRLCPLDEASLALLTQAARRMNLSARGYHRTIKVARTIADLAGAQRIEAPHIAEALQYRQPLGLEASS